ncbi:MAG: ABC-F family ATP-binding cassette domain-containing protein [Pseudomonadota bacterium]|jgi:ATP-binding cassette subfamily F protein 3|nr:ATP-binding cassette domain-containing protein [Alphaproteobacteria bacterium]
MLALQNLTRRFGGRVVLNTISYRFPEVGCVGLVGVNGSGKSTLLNILCGLDEPDDGTVTKPRNTVIGYLPQEPNPNPLPTLLEEALSGAEHVLGLQKQLEDVLKEMEHSYSDAVAKKYDEIMHELTYLDGFSIESEAKELLCGLGFSTDDFGKNPKTLSGGWRMRLELVRLFLKKPNFLVLDEPTNHLDLPSMEWVERFLKSFKGCLVFVSHDRSLINRLATNILHLHHGEINAYVGNYDKFLEAYELEQEQIQAQKQNLGAKAQQVQQFVDRFRASASKARQVQSRVKMLQKLYDADMNLKVDEKNPPMSVKLVCERKSGRVVLQAKDLSIGYSQPLVKKLSFKVERQQRLAIVGANGIGKSTLIKTLLGMVPKLEGTVELGHDVDVAYFAQDQLDYLMPKATVLENMMQINQHLSMGQARGMLGAFLFKGDDVFKPLNVLSGGEKNRVGLCCLLAKKANTIILDEPTNHLDMQSIDILAEALSAFEGTVLFVSHNRSFIDDVATHILGLNAKGQTLLVEGDLERFEAKAAQVEFGWC